MQLDEASLPGFAIRRQENQAIWAALTLRRLDPERADRLIEELDFHPWPEHGPAPSPGAIAFDTAAWIRWRSGLHLKLDAEGTAAALASIAPHDRSFPACLVPEAVLRGGSATSQSNRRAAAQLLRTLIDRHERLPTDHPGGILDVLLLRSRALLHLDDPGTSLPAAAERTCVSPPLEAIRRELSALEPSQVIDRCPY